MLGSQEDGTAHRACCRGAAVSRLMKIEEETVCTADLLISPLPGLLHSMIASHLPSYCIICHTYLTYFHTEFWIFLSGSNQDIFSDSHSDQWLGPRGNESAFSFNQAAAYQHAILLASATDRYCS